MARSSGAPISCADADLREQLVAGFIALALLAGPITTFTFTPFPFAMPWWTPVGSAVSSLLAGAVLLVVCCCAKAADAGWKTVGGFAGAAVATVAGVASDHAGDSLVPLAARDAVGSCISGWLLPRRCGWRCFRGCRLSRCKCRGRWLAPPSQASPPSAWSFPRRHMSFAEADRCWCFEMLLSIGRIQLGVCTPTTGRRRRSGCGRVVSPAERVGNAGLSLLIGARRAAGD